MTSCHKVHAAHDKYVTNTAIHTDIINQIVNTLTELMSV